MDKEVLDICGRRRSQATFSEFHRGRSPRNKGQKYPAESISTEEIVAVLQACPNTLCGQRGRALMVAIWRTGARINEALDLREQDLDERERSVFIRRGKGGKSRLVGMDDWGWTELRSWRELREEQFPLSTLFPVVQGPTAGMRWDAAGARAFIKKVAKTSGIQRRIHPHIFRHAHASELAREGVPLHIIQRQLGHSNLGTTAVYLQSISGVEVIDAVGGRSAPVMVPSLKRLR